MWRELNGALGTSVSSVFPLAHGRGPFASPTVPSGFCQEFPLGKGCAERSSLSAKPQFPVVSPDVVIGCNHGVYAIGLDQVAAQFAVQK
jgi:hypothetical protein